MSDSAWKKLGILAGLGWIVVCLVLDFTPGEFRRGRLFWPWLLGGWALLGLVVIGRLWMADKIGPSVSLRALPQWARVLILILIVAAASTLVRMILRG